MWTSAARSDAERGAAVGVDRLTGRPVVDQWGTKFGCLDPHLCPIFGCGVSQRFDGTDERTPRGLSDRWGSIYSKPHLVIVPSTLNPLL